MRGITRRGAFVAGAATLAAVTGLSPRRELFVLGDSWAAGLHADPAHALGQVAADALGWPVVVDAVSGTGYVNDDGDGQSYPERLRTRRVDAAATIAVLQGGSNDQGLPDERIAAAARTTVVLLRTRLPNARPVLLGPGPDPMPVTSAQRAVDRVLAGVAAAERVPYVSMLRQDWIAAANADAVLDPDNHHPTPAGQRYLGLRLAASLRDLFAQLTV